MHKPLGFILFYAARHLVGGYRFPNVFHYKRSLGQGAPRFQPTPSFPGVKHIHIRVLPELYLAVFAVGSTRTTFRALCFHRPVYALIAIASETALLTKTLIKICPLALRSHDRIDVHVALDRFKRVNERFGEFNFFLDRRHC